jgi:sulfoxide reductase heme-binding subunit YedZ|tara:strand:+ start:4279 stop:4416 length:138 start_codon:yes stop_codon:yes gene_type:complete
MKHPVFRSAVFIAAAVWPLLWLYQAWTSALGPDPGKVLVERLAGR